jgi:hypothetical protein
MNAEGIFKYSGRTEGRKGKGKNHRGLANDQKDNALAARIQCNK